MSQSEKMKRALLEHVIPGLKANGFCGEHPNYRRVVGDRIDIICFNTCKYENAFYVDISTVFPDRPKEKQNVHRFFDGDFDNVTTGDCRDMYRLSGNFGDQFFYTDVYFCWGYYLGVSENNKTFKPIFPDFRVQKATADIYKKVCDKVNKGMRKAYKWWDKMGKRYK